MSPTCLGSQRQPDCNSRTSLLLCTESWKMSVLPSTFLKSFSFFCLHSEDFICWSADPLNSKLNLRHTASLLHGYEDSRQNSTVVLRSLLDSHEIWCQGWSFRPDKNYPQELLDCSRKSTFLFTSTITKDKVTNVAPAVNGRGLAEGGSWPERFTIIYRNRQ